MEMTSAPPSAPPKFVKSKKFELPQFKKWEWSLIVFSLLLFLLSLALYISDVSLSSLIFGYEDFSKKVEVGKLGELSVPAKRKTADSIQFKEVAAKGSLFNHDTIVTDVDKATIQLKDGSVIELAPNTMIRLSFESTLGFGGIQRMASLDVISGSVEGKTLVKTLKIKAGDKVFELGTEDTKKPIMVAPPKQRLVLDMGTKNIAPITDMRKDPWIESVEKSMSQHIAKTRAQTPATAAISLIYPEPNAKLEPAKGMTKLSIPVQFKWTSNRSDLPTLLRLRKIDGKEKLLISSINNNKSKIKTYDFTIVEPGQYRWEVSVANEEFFTTAGIKSSVFSVNGDLDAGIVLDPPQTTDNAASSMVKLTWSAASDVSEYTVGAYRDKNRVQVIWKQKAKSNQVAFDLKTVFRGKIDPQVFFDVSATTNTGFVLKSNIASVDFGFFNTEPVIPGHNEEISAQKLKKEDKRMIFTWEKKNLATAYAFELSTDPQFKNMIRRVGTRENFVLLDPLQSGVYYWRIRVAIVGIWGPISGTHIFKMTE